MHLSIFPQRSKFVSLLFLAALFVAPTTFAQTMSPAREKAAQIRQERQATTQEIKAQRQETIQNIEAKRCELVTTRIELHTTRYNTNRAAVEAFGSKAEETITLVLERAQSKGKDTTALENVLTELSAKVDLAQQEHANLQELLQETQSLACNNTYEEFSAGVQKVTAQTSITRKAVLEARLYYQESVKPQLAALLKD